MPFQEDFTEFLDVDGGFASDAEVIPADGENYAVRGIFSKEYADIDDGFVVVSGNNPCFECAEEDVEGISYDDILRYSGAAYKVKVIKPDGNGWMTLILEEQ